MTIAKQVFEILDKKTEKMKFWVNYMENVCDEEETYIRRSTSWTFVLIEFYIFVGIIILWTWVLDTELVFINSLPAAYCLRIVLKGIPQYCIYRTYESTEHDE